MKSNTLLVIFAAAALLAGCEQNEAPATDTEPTVEAPAPAPVEEAMPSDEMAPAEEVAPAEDTMGSDEGEMPASE